MLIEPALLGLDLSDERRRQVIIEKKQQLERDSKRIKEEIESCEIALKKLDGGEDSGGGGGGGLSAPEKEGGMVATAAAALGGQTA